MRTTIAAVCLALVVTASSAVYAQEETVPLPEGYGLQRLLYERGCKKPGQAARLWRLVKADSGLGDDVADTMIDKGQPILIKRDCDGNLLDARSHVTLSFENKELKTSVSSLKLQLASVRAKFHKSLKERVVEVVPDEVVAQLRALVLRWRIIAGVLGALVLVLGSYAWWARETRVMPVRMLNKKLRADIEALRSENIIAPRVKRFELAGDMYESHAHWDPVHESLYWDCPFCPEHLGTDEEVQPHAMVKHYDQARVTRL